MVITETEIWKPKKDYEGLYEVSNFGRVKSLNYRRTGKAELLNPGKDGHGYLQVCLCKNKIYKMFKVHQLVAETFLPNPENKPCVNHKIEGKKGKKMNMVFFKEDGSIDEERTTIEWCTYEENNNYGTVKQRISKTLTNGKTSKKVLQFSKTGELIREWLSTQECGRNGFCQSVVWKCCNGKRKTAYGFIWKYKE